MAFESQDDFYIAKILVPQGTEVNVGSPILISVENKESIASFANYELPRGVAAIAVTAAPAAASSSSPPVATSTSSASSLNHLPSDQISLSPAARHLIDSNSYSRDSIKATGKKGRIITKEDVLEAIKSGTIKTVAKTVTASSPVATAVVTQATKPTATSSASFTATKTIPPLIIDSNPVNSKFTDIPNTNMRKIIAKRLTESKSQVPHFYVSVECEIDALLQLRSKFKKELDVNVSVNDLVMKASALALRDLPRVNSKWNVKAKALNTEGNDNAAISVAVATPSGLITPIVQNAQKLGLSEISAKVKDLAGRAKENKLKPEEFQGGSFSVSNLGMYVCN